MTQLIDVSDLYPHPRNPRLASREDVIEQIAAQLSGKLDEAHALLVRPMGTGYEIVSGHHRKAAAERAGIKQVPCWVRDLDDEAAYMLLITSNAQGELTALERGMHALHSVPEGKTLDVKAYAGKVGRNARTVADEVWAAKVAVVVDVHNGNLADHFSQLVAIHAAPEWLWPALAAKLIEENWTVDVTRKHVAQFQKTDSPPSWVDAAALATALLAGLAQAADVGRFEKIAERRAKTLRDGEADAERLVQSLWERLKQRRPSSVSEIEEICVGIEDEQRELIRVRRQGDLLRAKRDEEIRARTARLRRNVSLTEWNEELRPDERAALLNLSMDDAEPVSFNRQENDDIEWAMFSSNPVSGCRHDCPYCYAFDISTQPRIAKVYPHGFEPTLHPSTLLAPRRMKLPKEAATDARYKNVFMCSMGDLFGRWVPNEWIEAVLREIRNAPDWNFLCLTKFPKRMAEFDIPPNTWMGTSIDDPRRIPAAEAAFEKVNATVKWLSCEPLLKPLKFNRLELFDWIVVGGASASSRTPDFYPPSEWVVDLKMQARAAGLAWYEKTNLWGRIGKDKNGRVIKPGTPRTTELPLGLPVVGDSYELPEVFRYLDRATTANQKLE
jgi:protein gp37/ParB-like chromosome segregation protein Spo0J